ncbi:MAG: hypothetical protein ACRCUT_07105 [Spirochaetota bacterium]
MTDDNVAVSGVSGGIKFVAVMNFVNALILVMVLLITALTSGEDKSITAFLLLLGIALVNAALGILLFKRYKAAYITSMLLYLAVFAGGTFDLIEKYSHSSRSDAGSVFILIYSLLLIACLALGFKAFFAKKI